MSQRSKIGLAVAVVFLLVNLWGLVIAALAGEALHAGLHVLLAATTIPVLRRLAARRVAAYS